MLTRRRQWILAASVLLGATMGGVGTAQDNGKRPAVLPAPTNSSGAVTGPKAEPAVVPAPAAAAGPVESQSSCSWPPGNSPCCAETKPSFRSRWRHGWQHCFWGYPEEFEAAPLGYSVYLNGRTQVANGEAARMVLYHYDFVEGRDELRPRGRYQLEKITALLPLNFNPIIIEATPDAPGMDEARRVAVVRELAKGPFPVPAERIVIGRPIAIPLAGVEAELIYSNLLMNTQSQGRGAGAGAAGGFGRTGTTSSGILAPAVSPGGP